MAGMARLDVGIFYLDNCINCDDPETIMGLAETRPIAF